MGDIQSYILKKTSLLRKFLDATCEIKVMLDNYSGEEALPKIQKRVFERDDIITSIKNINVVLEENDAEIGGNLKEEYESHAKMWTNLLNQIKVMEDGNSAKIEELMRGYMEKVKSTKNSIRVIDAYAKQMSDEGVVNIDKRK